MSAPMPKAAQAAAASKLAETTAPPPFQPVHLKQTFAADASQHLFPALVFAPFIFRFHAFVADPVPVMWSNLAIVTALQVTYALMCLPVAGSATAGKAAKKVRPGEKKKAGGEPIAFVAAILSLLLTVSVTPFVYGIMVLFGAPVLTHIEHTFLSAAHLAILGLFPIFYVHGVDTAAWLAVAGFRAPLDEPFGGLVGAVVGAWLGAIPIPLDWDREWQKWPVTILLGIYLGWTFGKGFGGTLLFGKKL